jgi:hypothetical protein
LPDGPIIAPRGRWPALSGALPAFVADPPPPPPPPAPEAKSDPIAEAEADAVTYLERTARIRRLGQVPDAVAFGPSEDYLVRALVTGRPPRCWRSTDSPPPPAQCRALRSRVRTPWLACSAFSAPLR